MLAAVRGHHDDVIGSGIADRGESHESAAGKLGHDVVYARNPDQRCIGERGAGDMSSFQMPAAA